MAKCSDCGFLAIRDRQTRELLEVEQVTRDTGKREKISISSLLFDYPICLTRAYDLNLEMGERPNAEKILAVIQKERLCNEFTEWHQGLTPKGHWEMVDREARLKWQAEREDADRKWREQQEKWHSREEWKRYIFLAVITLVAVILGIILGHFVK